MQPDAHALDASLSNDEDESMSIASHAEFDFDYFDSDYLSAAAMDFYPQTPGAHGPKSAMGSRQISVSEMLADLGEENGASGGASSSGDDAPPHAITPGSNGPPASTPLSHHSHSYYPAKGRGAAFALGRKLLMKRKARTIPCQLVTPYHSARIPCNITCAVLMDFESRGYNRLVMGSSDRNIYVYEYSETKNQQPQLVNVIKWALTKQVLMSWN